jgi:hypothetical protein
MQLQLQFDHITFSITIFTTKQYLESPSRQGRVPSGSGARPSVPPMELARQWNPYLEWLGSSTQMGRDSYQRRDVSQRAASICSAWRRSSVASICSTRHRSSTASIYSVWRWGSATLMRRSSSIDNLAARRSSDLDLLRR